jgi:hypothetical protein
MPADNRSRRMCYIPSKFYERQLLDTENSRERTEIVKASIQMNMQENLPFDVSSR